MVNGIVNVYKEKGYTSFDVVAKMRGIMHQKKIGHTGTLDPDAEGVLPVCLGKATKVCDLLTDKDKVYEAVLLLGQETDTQDITGQILNQADVNVTEQDVMDAINSFVGKIMQVPPMYSALKVNGQKLYELARKGITVERKAREIEIFSIDIINISLPEVTMRVHCSKGTYIRTLCDDIGKKIGCFGCMKSLLRTKVSVFELDNALKLDEIESLVKANNYEFITKIDDVFENLPVIKTASAADRLLDNGNKFSQDFVASSEGDYINTQAKVYNSRDEFVGIYKYDESSMLFKPVKMFME